MAEKKGQKRTFISISSSPEQDEEEEQSQSEYDGVEDSIGTSTSCDDDDDDDDDESQFDGQECEEDEYSDYHDGNDDVQSVCDRIIGLLKEGSDLRELNLAECKTYLRKHGLRLSGAKAECIQRIKEHWSSSTKQKN
ncbi:hypothetical protein RJ639_042856 [Escallonia herrerae]|uniref:SAP domain-containing protein n=1 Tax=Escallonia herrerae TaxID=1293975 RepID=A0AA88WAD5_9ASTE|nr:hypothetical protein RJ639_042856 [Escallonia herrerae]